MPQPKKRIAKAKRTKQTYLGSGAGSMRSGTGTKAKSKSKSTRIKKAAKFVPVAFGAGSALKIAAESFGLKTSRPPKSPASGLEKVLDRSFTEAKKQRKRMATTMRIKAKR